MLQARWVGCAAASLALADLDRKVAGLFVAAHETVVVPVGTVGEVCAGKPKAGRGGGR